nr:TIGR02117 family protein [Tsuneonella aeria]
MILLGGGLAAAVLLFLLTAWIGSSLPRNADWTEPAGGIRIMVETNGIHTAIVMPLVTPQKDWRGDFPASDLAGPDPDYTHVSVSWGERAVFLDTPTWADLSPASTLRAATGSEGLLHVAHYVRPAPGDATRTLTLRPAEYARLVAHIERQMVPPEARRHYPGYADWDVFYTARGRYDWRNTCNQWTADALAAAGVRVGRWSPFAGGVMKWVPSPQS